MIRGEIVLAISDLQIPFEHKDALRFLKAIKSTYQPTKIVCIGDEIDFHAISDYEADPDGLSPGDEMRKALKRLKPYYKLFPKVMSCVSNHTSRPFRRAFKSGIPIGFLKTYSEFLEAPKGWEWRDYWIVDGVRYEHGHNLGGGMGRQVCATAPVKTGRSTVFGHFHSSAGTHFTANPEGLYFGMNVGCLIDDSAYAFAYSKNSKSRPILGCGIVDSGVPTFVPMLLNKGGRWVGELVG